MGRLDDLFQYGLIQQENYHQEHIMRMKDIIPEARKILEELDLQPWLITFSTFGSWAFAHMEIPDKATWEALVERCKQHPRFMGYAIQPWGEPQIDLRPLAVIPSFDGQTCTVRTIGKTSKEENVWEIVCGDAIKEERG